ncbi:MAG: MFS transporter [Acidobacteriota bacterium]
MAVPEIPADRVSRITGFLALQRSTAGLLIMVVLVDMGERMAERFLPVYILAVGGGALAIGLLQAMDNLLSALYSFPGGYLSDRIGARRSLAIFNLAAIAGFALVILIPAWQAVLAGAVLFISWSALSLPATMSLLYGVLPKNKRTMGVSMHSLVRRIPMALGPVIGGLCISAWGEREGVRMAFAGALGMAVIALFLQQWMVTGDGAGARSPYSNPGVWRLWRRMSPGLKQLLLSDILIRFCEQIPYAFVVVWCMKTIAEPVTAVQFGLLTTVEMATAVLVYIPVAYLADRSAKKPFVLITFGFFTLFPLALLYSRSLEWLIGAFILRGLKEFGEPTRKSLILDLSPEDGKAGMFGLYYLVRDMVVFLAAFGGAFLWQISPRTNLLTAFVFGLVGTAAFAVFGRDILTAEPGSGSPASTTEASSRSAGAGS